MNDCQCNNSNLNIYGTRPSILSLLTNETRENTVEHIWGTSPLLSSAIFLSGFFQRCWKERERCFFFPITVIIGVLFKGVEHLIPPIANQCSATSPPSFPPKWNHLHILAADTTSTTLILTVPDNSSARVSEGLTALTLLQYIVQGYAIHCKFLETRSGLDNHAADGLLLPLLMKTTCSLGRHWCKAKESHEVGVGKTLSLSEASAESSSYSCCFPVEPSR